MNSNEFKNLKIDDWIYFKPNTMCIGLGGVRYHKVTQIHPNGMVFVENKGIRATSCPFLHPPTYNHSTYGLGFNYSAFDVSPATISAAVAISNVMNSVGPYNTPQPASSQPTQKYQIGDRVVYTGPNPSGCSGQKDVLKVVSYHAAIGIYVLTNTMDITCGSCMITHIAGQTCYSFPQSTLALAKSGMAITSTVTIPTVTAIQGQKPLFAPGDIVRYIGPPHSCAAYYVDLLVNKYHLPNANLVEVKLTRDVSCGYCSGIQYQGELLLIYENELVISLNNKLGIAGINFTNTQNTKANPNTAVKQLFKKGDTVRYIGTNQQQCLAYSQEFTVDSYDISFPDHIICEMNCGIAFCGYCGLGHRIGMALLFREKDIGAVKNIQNGSPNQNPNNNVWASGFIFDKSEDYIVGDSRIGTSNKDPDFPHVCPGCKGPAYEGYSSTECKNNCGVWRKQ